MKNLTILFKNKEGKILKTLEVFGGLTESQQPDELYLRYEEPNAGSFGSIFQIPIKVETFDAEALRHLMVENTISVTVNSKTIYYYSI